jgi:hypothetical protein
LEVLKWACEICSPWDESIHVHAARSGLLDLLKCAHLYNYGIPGKILLYLKRADKNGCPLDDLTCSLAAEVGQLDKLKWALTSNAAKNGHLDVLIWAQKIVAYGIISSHLLEGS